MNKRVNQKNSDEVEFAPISLIDVIFILLIFFFLTQVSITGIGSGFVGGEHKTPYDKSLDLAAANTDARIVKSKKIDGVRILILRSEFDPQILEYYLLGYDNEEYELDRRNIREEDLDLARDWQESISLNSENDNEFLVKASKENNPFIVEGENIIKRYGIVPSEKDDIKREKANLKLFFKYIKGLKKFEDLSALNVEIKADESLHIGFINDIMTICGVDSIPKISFILKKKLKS